ncbi:MAG: LacI family transcriptional regulator [Candidatus Nanopelagicales bacterium]|nr:LacI family transcriptional regulator [Candidatus Nanopelagicales bacterium]
MSDAPRARLADIAEAAGVSEATVSRVLNDRPGASTASKQAVLTALDVLGYERPVRLRSAAGLVGLIVPELENPIFPAFAQVMEPLLAQSGFTPVLCTQGASGVSEAEYVELLLDRGVSGIIFISGMHADATSDHAAYRALIDRGLPVVFVNGFAEGIDAPFISDDDVGAMDLAVSHLASMGHRKIGLALGPERFVPVVRKRAGFISAMQQHVGGSMHDIEARIAHSLFSVEGGQAAAHHLLASDVSAIVCGSDLMALGVIRTIRQRGLRVPEDVSVVGYDDSPLIAFTDPPLTTVRQSVGAMGVTAVQSLLDEINSRSAPRDEFLFRPELVVRGSTAAVADFSP